MKNQCKNLITHDRQSAKQKLKKTQEHYKKLKDTKETKGNHRN